MGLIGQYETRTWPNTTSTRWSYFGLDGLGSVRQLLAGTSGAQTLVNYDPFGNPLDSMGLPHSYELLQ